VAAIAGRADIMEALAWGGVLHYGTQNGSRIGLYAARASLQALSGNDAAAFRRLWAIGEDLGAGLRQVFEETRTPAIVQQVGPMLQIMFTDRPAIRDYRDFCAHVDRDRYRRLAWRLFRHGIYMSPSAALHSVSSLAHSDDDVRCTVEAVRKALTDGE
jgi:glutamate-1-semialdehyde 2,1-aminomutase